MTERKSLPVFTCNLCYNPLSKSDNVNALATLSRVIKTCIGPRGKLKVIQNSTQGHTTITSVSQRLFQCISVKNFILRLIISSAKSQVKVYCDGGLRCAFLTLSLIQNARTYDISLPLTAALYDYYAQAYLQILKSESNHCVLNIDFSNLQHLKSIIKSILSSKPACLLSQYHKDYLCCLLLKTFLELFPNVSRILDNFNTRFLTQVGSDVKQSQLFKGVLISVPQIDWMLLSDIKYESMKVALFTTSLSGDVDIPVQNFEVGRSVSISDSILQYLQDIVVVLIEEKVDLVICQKVVHPSLKKQLNEANIVVLDQIGCESAAYLQYIFGGYANSSLFTKLSFVMVSCTKEKISNNHYILFHNDQFSFCSFLICNYNEEALSELKIVCQQIISTLFRLIRNPKICFGGGCTEIFTALLTAQKVSNELSNISLKLGCNDGQVISALHAFSRSITDTALAIHQGSQLDFVTETVHGHLWHIRKGSNPVNDETCMCGHCKASSVPSSAWNFLSSIENISHNFDINTSKENCTFSSNLILDELHSKVNSFSLASETAMMLLKTTLCISSNSLNNDNV